MRAGRSARSLLRYWSWVGLLKESGSVVRFRILSRILDRRELLGLLVLLELLELLELLVMMRSHIAVFGIQGTQVDFQ